MSARVDNQRAARAFARDLRRRAAAEYTRDLARGTWPITRRDRLGLALALERSMPMRGNWRLTSLWAPGCQCRMCGRKLHNAHVRAAHLAACVPKFFELWPIELAELLRRSYRADELAAIAAMCAGLAGGSR